MDHHDSQLNDNGDNYDANPKAKKQNSKQKKKNDTPKTTTTITETEKINNVRRRLKFVFASSSSFASVNIFFTTVLFGLFGC